MRRSTPLLCLWVCTSPFWLACGGAADTNTDPGIEPDNAGNSAPGSAGGGSIDSAPFGGGQPEVGGPAAPSGGGQPEVDAPLRVPTVLPSCTARDAAGSSEDWIAFDSDGEDFNRDLYRVRPDRSQLERLTDDPATDREPAFSPDGTRLAFTSDRSGIPQVYLLDLENGTVSQITHRLPTGADQPSFSHDGTLLVFHTGSAVFSIRTDGTEELFVGSGLDDFNAYFWPHFSADDAEVLVDRNNEINALRLQTGESRYVVSNTTTTIKSPAVSPDGAAVAYHVWCDMGGLSVWTTPFSTATQACKGRRVTPVSDVDSQRPAWGPGNLLAYERVDKATNVAKIALISRQEGELHCNLTPGPADNRNPSWWSPQR